MRDHVREIGQRHSKLCQYIALSPDARLAAEPSITRQILIGAILVVMMNSRPQGLLGERRVEVIT